MTSTASVTVVLIIVSFLLTNIVQNFATGMLQYIIELILITTFIHVYTIYILFLFESIQPTEVPGCMNACSLCKFLVGSYVNDKALHSHG